MARNAADASAMIREAKALGADFVTTPEMTNILEPDRPRLRALARREGEDDSVAAFAALAAELGLWLNIGSLALMGGGGKLINRSLLFAPDGRIAARYDKIHLFDVDIPGRDEGYRESVNAAPGGEAVIVDTPAGKVGLTVCYDLRFPELYRQLASLGAEIFTVPAAFTVPTGRAHWEVLLRARAIEDLCFVVAAAQSGFHPNGRETYGDSQVTDYWGRVLRRRPRGTGLVTATLDRAGQIEARERFPVLRHRVLE